MFDLADGALNKRSAAVDQNSTQAQPMISRVPHRTGWIGALLFMLAGATPCFAAGLVGEGRQNAITDCAACHRVTASQKPPALTHDPEEARDVAAPSFDVIARRYAGRPAALRAIIQAPRHPMREQQFLKRDLSAITRYIASLRSQHWK